MKIFKSKYLKTLFIKCFLINLIIFFFSHNKLYCQDAEFSQFFSNPLYLNPAFAGTNSCPRLSTNHRAQWTGLPNIFNTTSVSYDQNFDKIHFALTRQYHHRIPQYLRQGLPQEEDSQQYQNLVYLRSIPICYSLSVCI